MAHEGATGGDPAFLLSQLGAHAASRFAERLSTLELSPADAGIYGCCACRRVSASRSFRSRLKIHPSRLVAILDNLERRGLVERRPNAEDRRLYSLHLTGAGGEILGHIGKVAREHQDVLLAALSAEERAELAGLLQKVADEQG